MTDDPQLMCHKNLDHECLKERCPMWFTPPKPGTPGVCSEAFIVQDSIWTRIHDISVAMRNEAQEAAAQQTAEQTSES